MNTPISFGRRAEIYKLDDHKVLKLYDFDFPQQKVVGEFNKTLAIYNARLLNIPKPIEVFERDGRAGIIFEKVSNTALIDLFQKKPWLYLFYQKKITDIHKQIHKIQIKDLPTQVSEFESTIANSDKLLKEDKNDLLRILKRKHRPVLCHGDFHHGNLILRGNEYYVIDWMDAFVGDFRLDVALTAVNAAVSDAPKHVPAFYRYTYELLKRLFGLDKHYIELYGLKEQGMKDLIFLAAGIHLVRHSQKNDS